jgi:MFS transporter, DHA1 family, staphyloferrin B biosynthesis exporter
MNNIRSNEPVDLNDSKRTAPGITSTQYVSILFISAVADAILPVFYIFIPIFAVKIGANALVLGLVGGASYAVYSFMPFIMGHFSDRRGARKFFILSSLVLLCIVALLYSITSSPIALIVIRVFEGTGWAMFWPAIEAAITEDAFRESKKSLSVFNITWSGGAALGPVIGTILVSVYSYRFAFFTTGILFAILIVLNSVTLFRKKTAFSRVNYTSSDTKTEIQHVSLSSSIRKILFSGDEKQNFRARTCIVATSLSALTSAVFFTFFGPYATSLGLGVVLIGAITTTYGVVRFFTYVVFARGSLRQRMFEPSKRNRNVLSFASLACLSCLILILKDHSGIAYFVSFGLFAIGYSLVYSISQGTLIAETSHEQMGAGAGLFESSIGIGGVIGPVVAGAISSSSLAISFIVPAMGLVFALALLFVLFSIARRSKDGINKQTLFGKKESS